MHLSVSCQLMIGLKQSCRERRGGLRLGWSAYEVESHRPLISNDLGSRGPRLHGCVVLSRHSRLSEKQPSSGTETTFILWIKWQHNTLVDIRSHCGTKELLYRSISNREKHLDSLQGQCHQCVETRLPSDRISPRWSHLCFQSRFKFGGK